MYRDKFIVRLLAFVYFGLVFFAVIGNRLMGVYKYKYRVSHEYNLKVLANISDLGVNMGAITILSRFDWWFNVLLFCPFPTAFNVVFPEANLIKTWLMAIFSSFCIEFIQFIFNIGSADINDLLANSLGAFIGCFFTYFLNQCFRNRV